MVQQVLRQAERSVLYASPDKRGFTPLDVRPARRADARSRAGQRSPVGLRPRFDRVRSRPRAPSCTSGLLDGSATVGGLKVDTDLRWSILRRLVAVGHAGTEQIEAELSETIQPRDRLNAATCRAAIPTAQAKAEAWNACLNVHVIAQPHARRHGRRNHTSGTPRVVAPARGPVLRSPARCVARPDQRDRAEITMGLQPARSVEAATWNAPMRRSTAMSTSARRATPAGQGRDGVLRRCDASRRTPKLTGLRAPRKAAGQSQLCTAPTGMSRSTRPGQRWCPVGGGGGVAAPVGFGRWRVCRGGLCGGENGQTSTRLVRSVGRGRPTGRAWWAMEGVRWPAGVTCSWIQGNVRVV